MTSEPSTRERILLEAGVMIREGGLAALTMRRLATRLELSATALYRHFDDKGALALALCTEGFERLGSGLFKALAEPTPRARLVATALQYRIFALGSPNYYRAMFMVALEDALAEPSLVEENQRRFNATFNFLVDRVSECVSTSVLAPAPPRQLAATIWANCHGMLALYLDRSLRDFGPLPFAGFYDASNAALLRGLAIEAPS